MREEEQEAVVLAELLDALRWDETAANKVLMRTLSYPLRILYVALAVGKLPDEIGIYKLQTEVRLENAPEGNPVHTGALHRHLGNAVFLHVTVHTVKLIR